MNSQVAKQVHIPVLLDEAVEALAVKKEGCYFDATFGRGGHSKKILSLLGENGKLYACDRDPDAVKAAQEISDKRFIFKKTPFGSISDAFSELKENSLDGILFDLGVSSAQLDEAERGFSFNKTASLDMRMDYEQGITAKEWLMSATVKDLTSAIRDFGGEPHNIAKKLALAIFENKENLKTTTDLADLVSQLMPKSRYKAGFHQATKTFQAIRIVVNEEFEELKKGLIASLNLLKQGGILAVISFHSGEDQIVKRFMRENEGDTLPKEIPTQNSVINQKLKILHRPVLPSEQEILKNPRARSAKLRCAVKI